MRTFRIHTGDALAVLKTLPSECVQTIVTSPPYFNLRDYGVEGQLGTEATPAEYVENLVCIIREGRRVLRTDGTLWLNIADSYCSDNKWGGRSGSKNLHSIKGGYDRTRRRTGVRPKNLFLIPARLALALQDDGWIVRSDIIWNKPNGTPEPVKDRPTLVHEHIFLLAKSTRYYYDAVAVREPAVSKHPSGNGYKRPERLSFKDKNGARGNDIPWQPTEFRNRRSVWDVNTHPFPEAHFATFPPELIEPCILAGSREGDTVLDPFCGAGTTGLVSLRHARNFVGVELNPDYVAMARRRIAGDAPLLNQEEAA